MKNRGLILGLLAVIGITVFLAVNQKKEVDRKTISFSSITLETAGTSIEATKKLPNLSELEE
ncbi:hypothetical protein IW492_14665 [Enterococcus sp. BWB1-3]|uniref:hypothetical protein n=1 Tax=unclassified Enterococcus TaxID=2608891 RepID=UPI001921F4BF|nr:MULTISPECIES: hypothetical protein [unclassified Enterococcus]MBL1230472.1 hypothetical protein [Enterococcus sp. BWB1-3]MCB5950851.1 hypothetical protein [Enterococcus sp. BWT-B8]MCB5955291.1 hypothetical protein [Enterococcus sp. CWB-B31]